MSVATITSPTNPDHLARVEAVSGTITVSVDDNILCQTDKAVQLFEQSARGKYPPVLYFPKADTSGDLLPVEGRSTHCPLKGDASYFSFEGQEVAWIYDRPLKGAALLSDYVGFYSDKVNIKKT